jgi:hypothetical protein
LGPADRGVNEIWLRILSNNPHLTHVFESPRCRGLPELPVSNAGACAIDFSMAEFMDDN